MHKGKRIFLFSASTVLLLNVILICSARAGDFASDLKGGFKATVSYVYKTTGNALGPTVGPAVQSVQRSLYNTVMVNNYNSINSASAALTGAGINQHINTAFQMGVVKPYNALNAASNSITGVGINQNIKTVSQFGNYLKDTRDGVNIWQQDTALGVAQWVKDTHRGVVRYGGNALNMAAKGNVAVLPYTIDSFAGGVSDAGDRLECFQRDAGERLDEWTKDDPLKEDHVDRTIRELGLTGVNKPQVTRAMHGVGMFTSEDRMYKDDLKQVILNRINPQDDGRPLAVIIQSKADPGRQFTLKPSKDAIHNILSSGNRLYYAEVDTDTKAQYVLNSATENGENPANLIYLSGHGNQEAIDLGQGDRQAVSQINYLDIYNDQAKLSNLKDRLAPGGAVVFSSCSPGKGENKVPMIEVVPISPTEVITQVRMVEDPTPDKHNPTNMVNMFANIFPQANMVVGPTEDVSSVKVNFNPNSGVNRVEYASDNGLGGTSIKSYNGIMPRPSLESRTLNLKPR